MKTTAAKNRISVTKWPGKSGFELPSSLRDGLSSAIHGAFEVAVEIAVLEVTKLISGAAGDMFDKIQQENETLKEELQQAQSFIDSVRCKGSVKSAKMCQFVQDESCSQNRPDTSSADQLQSNGHQEDQRDAKCSASQGDDVSGSYGPENAAQTKKNLQKSNNTESNREMSLYCGVKLERINDQPCVSEDDPSVSFPDNSAPQLVKVKQEKPEDKLIASDYLVDSFKEEAMSQLQSEILEEWTPGGSHFEQPNESQAHGHSSNMDFNLDPALESSSLALDLPVTDHPAPSREHQPFQIYGAHVRHNQGSTKSSLHICKLCGQTFPLPSLLRRHHGQCQQKFSQRVYVPTAGGKRTKLQLYPPGCSPFQCPECNREFNRMENLKTHLRIHTGERPYKCTVCSTAFRHSGALTRHFRIHTGEKPYVCGLCGRSFRNCGGLKFHQRSHNKQMQS